MNNYKDTQFAESTTDIEQLKVGTAADELDGKASVCSRAMPEPANQMTTYISHDGANQSGVGAQRSSPPVELTRYTNRNGLLTKRFRKLLDGTIEKTTAAQLSSGTAETLAVNSLEDLASLIGTLEPSQCIGFGVMGRPSAEITTVRGLAAHPGSIARSREYFRYSDGPAIMMLDHDALDGDAAKSPEELRSAVIAACPALGNVPMLWTASASSCITDESESHPGKGLRGQRLYLFVQCGLDIPRAGAALYERLWLLGYGRYVVSKSGSFLDRNIIDSSVWQPERADFAAGAKCEAPLVQRRPAPRVLGPLDGQPTCFNSLLISELTDAEKLEVTALKEAAREAIEPERAKVHGTWLEERVNVIVEATKVSKAVARDALTRAENMMELAPEFVLHAADGKTVKVAEILANPARWKNQRFADPLEPDYRSDGRIASLNIRGNGDVQLHSHAHGGRWYTLVGKRAVVIHSVGETARTADMCLAVLQKKHELFDFGSHSIARVSKSGRIYLVGADAISDYLSRAIDFHRYNPKKERFESGESPRDLPKIIAARNGERPLPELLGVITAPTLRHDGSILSKPGYDPISKLYYKQSSLYPPHVPHSPDRQDVEKAFARLWEPFAHFPFANATSRGVVLAALLSATVRRSLPTCPAFALDAPTAGSGKTLLARCIAALAGGDASTSPPPGDDEEMRKVLFAFLRTSDECLIFDNVIQPVTGAAFNQFVTEPLFSGRVLGQSEIQKMRNNCLLILTGNNLRVEGDACRRVLTARIDAVSEAPHLRTFNFCPLAVCRSRRMELTIDALTILRGYIAAGAPEVTQRGFASFEAWNSLVRQAVCWLSTLAVKVEIGDPIDSIFVDQGLDPAQAAMQLLLPEWKAMFGNEYHQISTVIDGLRKQPALYEAVQTAMQRPLTCFSFPTWLRKNEGILVNGMRLHSYKNSSRKSTDWAVQEIAESS